MPSASQLSELTVTCNQCGSASLERLDRKEYRCNHCGAITLISDNDADRIETLLRNALAKQQRYQPRVVHAGSSGLADLSSVRVRAALAAGLLGFGLLLALLLHTGQRGSPPPAGFNGYSRYVPPKQIPLAEVTLSPPEWIGSKGGLIPDGMYHALLYNHSGSTITVPEFGMTFFPGGMKGGSAIFTHDVQHLLPGEYTHVSFRTFGSKDANARYEVESPSAIQSSDDELVRLPVEQPQLVRQEGRSGYEFVGVIRNTAARALAYASVGVVLYGPDHQLLGGASGSVGTLRPGEKGVVHTRIDVEETAPQVRSYEYLVDATLERRP